MKYTIIIDDETQAGAGLLEVAKSISLKYKSVKISKGISEDEWLASEIKKSKKTGQANKQKILNRFNIE
jgi:hypothetical protein